MTKEDRLQWNTSRIPDRVWSEPEHIQNRAQPGARRRESTRIHHESPYRIGKSHTRSEFQPGMRLAESLVEIPTPRVRFLYPTWMDYFFSIFSGHLNTSRIPDRVWSEPEHIQNRAQPGARRRESTRIHHESPYRIGKSHTRSEFQPGMRLAESLVEIPTPRVRFLYPTWMDYFFSRHFYCSIMTP